jgi:hypothetical protein
MRHLTEGNTGWKGASGGMAAMDRRGGGSELGCSTSRTRRDEAWVQNGTSGGRGSSCVLFIGRGEWLGWRYGGGLCTFNETNGFKAILREGELVGCWFGGGGEAAWVHGMTAHQPVADSLNGWWRS